MAKASTETKPYIAKTAIRHDKDDYAPGEELELTEAQAKPLLEVKAVEPAPVKAAKPKDPATGGDQGSKPPKTEKPKGPEAGKDKTPPADQVAAGADGKPAEGAAQS